MRWKLVFIRQGVLLFHDGAPIAFSNDPAVLLSVYGELTRQNEHALVS